MSYVKKNILLAATLYAGITLSAQSAFAGDLSDISPEVAASTWQEDGQEYASVSLNGKELLVYKAGSGTGIAEKKAEDLATKIEELIDNDKLDPDKLLPGKEGDLATIRLDGSTLVKFELPETELKTSLLEQSLKLVNSLRSALGAPQLPATFLKVADAATSGTKVEAGSFSGHASWYGGRFHGRRTSDGSRFDQDGFTAAHRTLPFGTKLLVMNRRTRQSCVVQVNDRGPFIDGRIIDVSRGAAKRLNMISSGVALVDCLVLGEQ